MRGSLGSSLRVAPLRHSCKFYFRISSIFLLLIWKRSVPGNGFHVFDVCPEDRHFEFLSSNTSVEARDRKQDKCSSEPEEEVLEHRICVDTGCSVLLCSAVHHPQ